MKASYKHAPLRLAFWTLMTTSGLYWLLALLVLSATTACSGSIYSDKKTEKQTLQQQKEEEANRRQEEHDLALRKQQLLERQRLLSQKAKNTPSKPSSKPKDSVQITRRPEGRVKTITPRDESETLPIRSRTKTIVTSLDLYRLIFPSIFSNASDNTLDSLTLVFDLGAPRTITPKNKSGRSMIIRDVLCHVYIPSQNNGTQKLMPYQVNGQVLTHRFTVELKNVDAYAKNPSIMALGGNLNPDSGDDYMVFDLKDPVKPDETKSLKKWTGRIRYGDENSPKFIPLNEVTNFIVREF